MKCIRLAQDMPTMCFCQILTVDLHHGCVISTFLCERGAGLCPTFNIASTDSIRSLSTMAAEKIAEVRNDLQTLNGRANFSIGYRFARITAACCHRLRGCVTGCWHVPAIQRSLLGRGPMQLEVR